MEKEKADELIKEMNSLSTKFDEQSRMRMKEIAHILVTEYYKFASKSKKNI